MGALSADRMAKSRSLGRAFSIKLAANAIGYQNGLAAVGATGFGKAAGTTAGDRVVGWFSRQADNTGGADGALSVEVQTGILKLDNDATNPVTQADIGRVVFVKDDHTVQTGAGGSSVVAGKLEQIDADGGCWVTIDDAVSAHDGKSIDVTADNNAVGGIPVVHVFNIANTGANSDNDITLQEKFEVLDVEVLKSGAGAGNTVQIQTGAGVAISDAIAAAVDKALTRAAQIDQANNVIAAGQKLRAHVAFAAGSTAMKVIVTGRKVP